MEFVALFDGRIESIIGIEKFISMGNRLVAIFVPNNAKTRFLKNRMDFDYYNEIASVLRCELIIEKEAIYPISHLGANTFLVSGYRYEDEAKQFCDIYNKVRTDLSMQFLELNSEDILGSFLDNISINIFNQNTNSNSNTNTNSNSNSNRNSNTNGNSNTNTSKFDLLNRTEKEKIIADQNNIYRVTPQSVYDLFSKYVYVDNATTCFPKMYGTGAFVSKSINTNSFGLNRGTYSNAYELLSDIIDVRYSVLEFLKAPKGFNCIFSPSSTYSINMILRGILKDGDEVIIDERMHNSVSRTVSHLRKKGVLVNKWSSENEKFKVKDLEKMISDKTKIIFLTMIDNVSGKNIYDNIDDLKRFQEVLKENNIYYILDAVQAVCERNISIEDLQVDALIASSNIGFMSIEGTSILVGSKRILNEIEPIIFGGTGSISDSGEMPSFLPDKLEAGTINTTSILALGNAIKNINMYGVDNIIEKKHNLANDLRERLNKLSGVHAIGDGSFLNIFTEEKDEAMVMSQLDLEYNIMARVGIHCSFSTHISQGSFPNGSIRMSIGYFNSKYDVDYIAEAFKSILEQD